ncbi:hypothetical protein SISSUDRAFT_989470 [Sistotremastrum suecicum HHB10207 ss-3]|uniref:Bet v1-like protein n=1 Tax=Sistotremastrum suecicum HHB10207 ss-3 TaxID=1314776 RepID=A0A166BD35_9AGAM|nr:hypothetical protein SISSUDRAFT_989470 [Sistotremastrum suecicum HHB10207 ss-3]
MAASNLPNGRTGVFPVISRAEISAPVEVVWNTLIDFKSYREWNAFVPSQQVADKNWKPINPEPQTIKAGDNILVHAYLQATGSYPAATEPTISKETIVAVDHAQHRIRWDQKTYPSLLLWTERWQALSEQKNDAGENIILYESRIVFGGLGAYFVKWLYASRLNAAVALTAEGLKTRCEGLV